MKTSQKDIIVKQLKEYGEISRNWCLKNYISRLSAIIQLLEKDGWRFESIRDNGDYIYKVTQPKYKKIEYFVPAINKHIIKYERI